MRRCSPELSGLVYAAIDSMGVVNHKGGVSTDLSPQQTVIEETKVALRKHYVCYEEARRQLEFLEQGGDPLDFRPGNAASHSVQSTSLTDQHPEQFVISEAKGSFALADSPPGDSVESSGRPEAPPTYEPNSADNLMLFDGENSIFKGERSLLRSNRDIVFPSEQSSQLDGSRNAKESGATVAFGLPKKAYRRRNRSRPSRDGGRSNSVDVVLSSSGHSMLPSRHVSRELKVLTADTDNQKDNVVCSNYNLKPTSPNHNKISKAEPSKNHFDMEIGGGEAIQSYIVQSKGDLSNAQTGLNASTNMHDKKQNDLLESEAQITNKRKVLSKPASYGESKQASLGGPQCDLSSFGAKVEDTCSLTAEIGGDKGPLNEFQNKNAVMGTKSFDLGTCGNQSVFQLNGNVNSETCTNLKGVGSNGCTKEETVASVALNMEGNKSAQEVTEAKLDDMYAVDSDNNLLHDHQENGPLLKSVEALNEIVSGSQSEANVPIAIEGKEQVGITSLEDEIIPSILLDSNPQPGNENTHSEIVNSSVNISIPENRDTEFLTKDSAISPEQKTCSEDLKLKLKAHEDSILEEARVVEAKRKRIAELSIHMLRRESRQKSHWDFVLEEMAWLANDFAQERLWKISAAAQIGRQATSAARLKFGEQDIHVRQKQVACCLAKAVKDFWRLVEVKEEGKKQELQNPVKDYGHTVQGYALRFLHCNNSPDRFDESKVATRPDSISSLQNMDMSWKYDLTEESLFYSVPAGAMEIYRSSIEAHILQLEKTGISIPEEVEPSGYDALAEYGFRENAFEEDEGETNTYYLPGAFGNSKPSKLLQKKKKHLMKELAARSYEMGSDLPFVQSVENKAGNHHSVLIGKRASNAPNASIPTKRMRTASRQRVPSPFNAGTHGCLQAPSKGDASSGDTNSFHDEQNNLQGGSDVPHNMEVESVRNMDRQLPVDSSEVLHKPKKKKKAKNLGSTYEYNWRSDSSFHNEQRDNYKRRSESHHFESNGNSGLYGQHIGKKPKLIKQPLDNSFDNVNCSISSPVASQMSNMSNPNKFIKMLGGRDRGRKTKGLKSASGQLGSGTSWSLFEDQALVVLVHDMGPNWDLVSDAFNSTLKFKCIFRKPKECKERHKVLMDSPAGEGADSADDSGSSQPYRSTLPGIPKGSARQLFQRLQGPMEEDTIKSHLEKIIAVGKKQHHKRAQDPRPLQQPHNSHTFALSQVCPNNLNGGPILTPLDLCDATVSSPDVLSLGYQSPQSSGIPNSNQGSIAPMHPASGANLSAQAFAGAVPGSNLSSATSQISNSVRDVRSGIPRSASLTTDEQQRLQQYSQMVPGRNFQQSNIPVSGVHSGTDRGVRMLTSGNGVGIPSGLHRSIPGPRAGLQGIASSSMVGPGSMLSSGMMAMPNPVNIHSGPGAAQGNSMMRPRDPMHMMRPTQNVEHQRQMMIPELQMQVALGNSQGIPPFGGLSSSFPNQTTAPSVPSYPLHQQLHPISTQQSHMLTNSHHPHLQGPNLANNTQHQAYAIRVAKEKQMQQRVLQQHQQQQFAPSNSVMPHVPGQPQQVSSPQNGSPSQSTPQVSMSPLTVSSSMSSMSSNPKKHHIPTHIVVRNAQGGGSGSINQASKQRQRQPQQQQVQHTGRHHPQQRHLSQSQNQAKITKGVGRGNLMHENLLTDNTLPNGPSTTPGSHIAEKGEENVHVIQGEELYSGSGLNSVQPQKQSAPSHFSHQPQVQQKQNQQTRAHSENSNQNHVPSVVAGPTSNSSQDVPSNQQQHKLSQPFSKIVNQTQSPVQILLHQNRQVNHDHAKKLQARDVHSSLEPASTVLRKASEHVSDSCSSNPVTAIGSADSPPLTNPPIEPLNPAGQGIEKIQSLVSLPHVAHDGDVLWSEESSQLQPPPPLEQQPEELKQQSEEQSLILQGGGSSS